LTGSPTLIGTILSGSRSPEFFLLVSDGVIFEFPCLDERQDAGIAHAGENHAIGRDDSGRL